MFKFKRINKEKFRQNQDANGANLTRKQPSFLREKFRGKSVEFCAFFQLYLPSNIWLFLKFLVTKAVTKK